MMILCITPWYLTIYKSYKKVIMGQPTVYFPNKVNYLQNLFMSFIIIQKWVKDLFSCGTELKQISM